MTIDEAINKIDFILDNMSVWLEEIISEVALNALAIVVIRIQQQGLPGRKYSDHKLPEYYFDGKDLNPGGRNLLAKKDKKKMRQGITYLGHRVRKNTAIDAESNGISYREWREANGLQTAFVDLTFSGRMFQNLSITEVIKSDTTIMVKIAATDKEVINKLRWNAQRFGSFLILTPDEEAQLSALAKALFNKKLNSVF